MNLTVFGSTSRTGLLLLPQAQQRGHHVTACSRHPERLPNPGELAAVVKGDARELAVVGGALARADAAVVIVNGGSRRTPHQAEEVVATVLAGMGEHGVSRLVVTSAYPATAPNGGVAMAIVRRVFATPYADVVRMERAVSESSTAWTIVRLNRLSDNASKGRLEVSREPLATPRGLHRVDAARLLLETVEDTATAGAALNVAGPGS